MAVSLSADSIKQSSAAASAKVQEIHEVISPIKQIINDKIPAESTEPPLEEGVSVGEERATVSTTEKFPEALEQAATGIPDPREEAIWLAQIHHSYITQTRAFMDNFLQSIEKGLSKAIESNQAGSLREGTGEVTFYFNDEGGIGEVWGATNSKVLESALNRLDWRSVPLPGEFRLRITGLRVKIRIHAGEPSLSFTVL